MLVTLLERNSLWISQFKGDGRELYKEAIFAKCREPAIFISSLPRTLDESAFSIHCQSWSRFTDAHRRRSGDRFWMRDVECRLIKNQPIGEMP
jgi:hypothetical protein